MLLIRLAPLWRSYGHSWKGETLMPKVWNLGNTSIRNPNRIELGLRVFAKGFQGRVHGKEAETRFAQFLASEGVLESEGTYSDLFGRKWRSVFVKLGFATDCNYRIDGQTVAVSQITGLKQLGLRGLEYELTPVGSRLLQAGTTAGINDIYLRQLVCHEIPSPIEGSFPPGSMKPFIYLISVLDGLRSLEERGLNKTEVAIFLQLFANHDVTLVQTTVDRILEFRREMDNLPHPVARKAYAAEQLVATSKVGGVSPSTLQDYADTTIRYAYMTGLLAARGSRVELRSSSQEISQAILAQEPRFLADADPEAYLVDFYSGTELPQDNPTFALAEVRKLEAELVAKGQTLPDQVAALSASASIQDIQPVRYALLEELGWTREEEFARAQQEDSEIRDIIAHLEALETQAKSSKFGISDRPTFLEWAVWRGLLAIDHLAVPIHTTRRFPIDDDCRPRHPAPGGGADMLFETDHSVIVVEVTLSSSSRQEAMEGEPVRRHVADIKLITDKDVYGLFIAPTIDNNTAETFRSGVWYRGDQEDYVNIVPLTLAQFRSTMRALLSCKYTPVDLEQLFDRCLSYRNARPPEWKRMIQVELDRWLARFPAATLSEVGGFSADQLSGDVTLSAG